MFSVKVRQLLSLVVRLINVLLAGVLAHLGQHALDELAQGLRRKVFKVEVGGVHAFFFHRNSESHIGL